MTRSSPKASRWDRYPTGRETPEPYPPDPILWALCKRREDVARRLLERKGALSWEEGALYAPWTLNWSPALLRLILDLSPREEELGCCREFVLPDGTARVRIKGSLIMAAAALDDLPAVELLLERGYSMGGRDSFEHGSSPFCKDSCLDMDHMKFPCLFHDCSFLGNHHEFLLSPVRTAARGAKKPADIRAKLPAKEWSEGREILPPDSPTSSADATAIALLCGNIRVLRRLLRHPPALKTSGFHKALSILAAAAESEPLLACLRAAEEIVGMPAAQFVDPGRMASNYRNSAFFLDCLRCHDFYGGENVLDMVWYIGMCMLWRTEREMGPDFDWVDEAVCLVSRERLLATVTKFLPPMPDPDWAGHPECPVRLPPEILQKGYFVPPLMASMGLRCVLERDAVLPDSDPRLLLMLLHFAELTGRPPSVRLSGAARCLLQGMCIDAEKLLAHRGDVPNPLFQNQRALDILNQENPCRILPFVNDLPFSRESRLFLLSMLPLEREEEPYAL